jgi:HEAT repeat protein
MLGDANAVEPLIRVLSAEDAEARRQAATALRRIGTRAVAPLLDAYAQGGRELRRTVLGVLQRSRSKVVADTLLAALDDPDEMLRMIALGMLIRRKESRAVGPLIAGLDDPGPWREICAWALGRIGDPAAFEPLSSLILLPGPALQMAVIKSLRQIDNPRAVDLLHALLDDAANPHRDRLARTLAALDLMGAVGVLCRKARLGTLDHDCLYRAIGAVHAEAERVVRERGPRVDAGGAATSTSTSTFTDPPADLRAGLRRSAAAMRRLEANLRNLARGD